MLPYYIAVSAVYGGLTWAANSILPALVLHAVGDIVVLTRWWLTGRPGWQIGSVPPPLVWESGIDAHFVLTGVASDRTRCAAARRARDCGAVARTADERSRVTATADS